MVGYSYTTHTFQTTIVQTLIERTGDLETPVLEPWSRNKASTMRLKIADLKPHTLASQLAK